MTPPLASGSGRPFRRVAVAVVAALALTATAACSSSGDDEQDGSDRTVRVGAVGAGPATADPHGSLFNESDWVRLSAIYDPLVGVDEDGAPAPALAESWEVDDTASEWTFTLRDDAQFSDGSPVTSADVMYSLGRIDELADQNGARLGSVDMGASSAPDEHTVVLATSVPDAELLTTLAGSSFIVPDGTESFDEPVGSGPFVVSAQDESAASLESNPDWWGGEPASPGLEIRAFADPRTMNEAVTSGEIDLALGVEPAAAATAEDNDDLQVIRRPAGSTTPLLMRLDEPPFDEPGVREAVKLAIDREALVENVYLGFGQEGADLPQPNDPSAPNDLEPPARDVETAEQALAEAGYPDGVDITLHTSAAYPSMVPTATLVAEQLAEAGIRVEIAEESPDTYWTETYGQVPFSVGYYSQMPYPVWVRQTALSDSAFNETQWRRPDFDSAFEEAMATTDTDQRREQLADLQREMAAEGGVVAWGHGDGLTVASSDVDGLSKGPGFARLKLTDVAISS
ncbi:hypothetical protein BHE97_04890 [Aeromicrobium sp. PE09-221]|uniref:ABC transporter substrate-binding protein n=1 Tax=Aeromicrobium sp. PE09-221 TaxID=1898043 RepID=UPI000B3EBAF7|nr:ABC transporter substrate-binding protein [Aeromicrobium sp. PE09-221]OUZ11190.1 hypothetical protein BHE97_04890 [Aeromicrobium sp. PE09-221]